MDDQQEQCIQSSRRLSNKPSKSITQYRSRYDIGRQIIFHQKSDGSFIDLLEEDLKVIKISKHAIHIFSNIGKQYKLAFFVLISSGKNEVIYSLIRKKKQSRDNLAKNKMGKLWTKPVLVEKNKQIIYFLEFSTQMESQILEEVIALLSPIISHLCLLNTYPLNKSQLQKKIKIATSKLFNDNILKQDLQHHLPELLVLLQCDDQQQYNRRNKNLDRCIFEEYLKPSKSENRDQELLKILIKKYYKLRDCIVLNSNPEDYDQQLEYIRLKILKTRVKPLSYFNFNGEEIIAYLEEVLQMKISNNEKKYNKSLLQLSNTIKKKTLKFKRTFINSSQQCVYNTWSEQIDSFFQERIIPKIKENSNIQIISKFIGLLNNELKKKLNQNKEKILNDKAQIIQNQEKRLRKIFNYAILPQLCLACGFRQDQIKYYIQQLSEKAENQNVHIGEINLEVMQPLEPQSSNIPLQSNINPKDFKFSNNSSDKSEKEIIGDQVKPRLQ